MKYATFNFSIEHEGMGQVTDADVEELVKHRYPRAKTLDEVPPHVVAEEHIRKLTPELAKRLLTIAISNLEITER